MMGSHSRNANKQAHKSAAELNNKTKKKNKNQNKKQEAETAEKKKERKERLKKVRKMKKRMMGIVMGAMTGMMVFGTAAGTLAANIGLEDAKKTALEAVGVTEDQVIFKKAAQDMDDGREIFEIDFFVPHEVKYEFNIDANTGMIADQDMDLWEADDDAEYAFLMKDAAKTAAAAAQAAGEITELQAKTIAVNDAGLDMNAVTFTKCRRDTDDGVEQFEIEFHTADFSEFDYDICMKDGRILDKGFDFADFDD